MQICPKKVNVICSGPRFVGISSLADCAGVETLWRFLTFWTFAQIVLDFEIR